MSKIEIGMRVRCVDPAGCIQWYSAGAEGIVIDADNQILVRFDAGEFNHECDGEWFGHPSYFEVVNA